MLTFADFVVCLHYQRKGVSVMSEKRIHGYARVSSKEQNEIRQLNAFKEFGILDRDIYVDKQSGKDFNRIEYQRMVNAIRKNDLVVILSIDRLGRNYSKIQEQWRYITDELGADIKVLDMPLLDTSANVGDLDKRFIADLTSQILSYVANKEREAIKKRQKQGLDLMPVIDGKQVSSKTNRPIGRPIATYPDNWDEVYTLWHNKKEITAKEAMTQLGLRRSTFYKLVGRCE